MDKNQDNNHSSVDNMQRPQSNQEFCFAMILLLANRFQTKLDHYTGEITLKQWLLLCMLVNMGTDSASVNDLAAVVGYSRQNVKKMVDILVTKGYLNLETSPSDKRAYEVKLTEKSKQFFREFEDLGDKILEQLFNSIPEENLAIAGDVMGTILNNTETM